jgi:hypothetical protein
MPIEKALFLQVKRSILEDLVEDVKREIDEG